MGSADRLKETLFKVESVVFLIYSQLYANTAKAGTEEERMKQIKTIEAFTSFHSEIMKYAVNASVIVAGNKEECRRGEEEMRDPLPHPFEELEGKSEAEILGWLKEKASAALAETALENARKRKEENNDGEG